MDNLNEILKEDKFKEINNELKRQGYEKVALNLSQIDDDEYISIEFSEGSFSYQLPFTINLENTGKLLKSEIISKSDDVIKTEKITIHENGLIRGNDFENYENALYAFMEILSKLRRNI